MRMNRIRQAARQAVRGTGTVLARVLGLVQAQVRMRRGCGFGSECAAWRESVQDLAAARTRRNHADFSEAMNARM